MFGSYDNRWGLEDRAVTPQPTKSTFEWHAGKTFSETYGWVFPNDPRLSSHRTFLRFHDRVVQNSPQPDDNALRTPTLRELTGSFYPLHSRPIL